MMLSFCLILALYVNVVLCFHKSLNKFTNAKRIFSSNNQNIIDFENKLKSMNVITSNIRHDNLNYSNTIGNIRGLVNNNSNAIKTNDILAKLPLQSCLYAINDYYEYYQQYNDIKKDLFLNIRKGTNRLAILLIDEIQNPNSNLKQYIDILPMIDTVITPIHWDKNLLQHFPYKYLINDVSLQSKNWFSLYKLVLSFYEKSNIEFVSYQVYSHICIVIT